MKLKQLSLFLENQPGALSRPIQLLARGKINILTLLLLSMLGSNFLSDNKF